MLGDRRQQRGPVLEARAINEAENRRGGLCRQVAQRAEQGLPAEAVRDIAVELAAGMGYLLRIDVGEEIGDERRVPGSPRGLRDLPSRDGRDQ
ncbi:MAG TPA: hypothetical protein VHK26_14960 [Methyloceanibacter sp.]|nr:hypothetical protein [Methyloceanibacter sp.]